MKKLILLGAVMALAVSALTSVAASAADTTITEADADAVLEAEGLYWTGEGAKAESDYPAHIAEAGEARYAFQETGQYMDGAYWQELIGEDVFGGANLELDGTVTIQYVGKEPAALLPGEFKYNFVQVEKTLKERNENPEPFDDYGEAALSWPNASDTKLRAGQTITLSCGNSSSNPGWPLNRVSPRSQATKTIGVTFIENGSRRYGTLTAGHTMSGDSGCDQDNEQIGKHFKTHLWTGWQVFPVDGAAFDDSNAWWNAEGSLSNGGRTSGGRTGYWADSGSQQVDIAIVKRGKKNDLRRAHLGPYRGTGSSPWTANHGWFYRMVEYPITGTTWCTSRTSNAAGVQPGTDCGILGANTTNQYWLDVSSGIDGQSGESGSPVHTRHDKPYVGGIVTNTAAGTSHEFIVRRLWDQLVRMENAFSELSGIEMCGTNPSSSTISDRTHYCG